MADLTNNLYLFTTQVSRIDGGIGNTSFYLAQEFSKKYKVTVYTSRLNNENQPDITIHKSPFRNNFFKHLFFYFSFLRQKKKGSFSVCMSWRCALIPYLFRKRCKYIVLVHGNEVVEPEKHSIKVGIGEKLKKRILSNATFVCCNSKFTSQLASKYCNSDRIRIIHPCSGEPISNNNNSAKNHLIFSIGRLEFRKGFQFAIEAIKQLEKSYKDIKYIIGGDGPYKQNLVSLIQKLNLHEKVSLVGRLSEEDKKKYLDECNLLVMPSFFDPANQSIEGFGIVFVEANAHGKPVIGTKSGGIPDAIINGKTGIIVEEKSSKEIAKAIDDVFRKKIVFDQNALKKWAMSHAPLNISSKYVDLLDSIKQY